MGMALSIKSLMNFMKFSLDILKPVEVTAICPKTITLLWKQYNLFGNLLWLKKRPGQLGCSRSFAYVFNCIKEIVQQVIGISCPLLSSQIQVLIYSDSPHPNPLLFRYAKRLNSLFSL